MLLQLRSRFAAVTGAIATFGLLTAGCNGGTNTVAPPDLAPPPPDLSGDLKDNSYPLGPFAADVGMTLPDFTFQGYYSPTATTGLGSSNPFGEVTFGRLHDSGAKYAMIHLAAFW